MIESTAAFEQSLQQLGQLYRALRALRLDQLARNRTNFGVLASGLTEQIRRLVAELDEYSGRSIAEAELLRLDVGSEPAGAATPSAIRHNKADAAS